MLPRYKVTIGNRKGIKIFLSRWTKIDHLEGKIIIPCYTSRKKEKKTDRKEMLVFSVFSCLFNPFFIVFEGGIFSFFFSKGGHIFFDNLVGGICIISNWNVYKKKEKIGGVRHFPFLGGVLLFSLNCIQKKRKKLGDLRQFTNPFFSFFPFLTYIYSNNILKNMKIFFRELRVFWKDIKKSWI